MSFPISEGVSRAAADAIFGPRLVSFGHLFDDDGNDGCMLTVLEAERTSSSSDSSEMQKARYTNA
jgi:hypothetical protein